MAQKSTLLTFNMLDILFSENPKYIHLQDQIRSFFILPTHDRDRTILQFLFQKLVYRERDRLAGSNTHNPRRNSLIKSVEPFLSIFFR